jgi:hypothetical protein
MLDTLYNIPEDRALARIPDLQGLGGSSSMNATRQQQPGTDGTPLKAK